MLIGGAGGGVGGFAVQLARIAGARVIGTGAAETADHLRGLGAEPVVHGEGLADRARALAPRELGVPDSRICTVAAQVDGVTAANGASSPAGALEEIAVLVAAGRLRVPLAATFPVEEVRRATALQADRHVRGMVVIDL
ncbi:zinc-binding dehydrogenase [Streptomyces pseudogriseolus]|uniref:zinc-binding dehydrogenase n=1 Tax=Streptomyces pseudogriseolus TaxID=36817 RepID=UPI003FA242A1